VTLTLAIYQKAIFALGNLALAMNEHDAMEFLAANTVVDISNAILAAMSDSNDKVCCRFGIHSLCFTNQATNLKLFSYLGGWECDPIHRPLGERSSESERASI
jgi:hypothetical protein